MSKGFERFGAPEDNPSQKTLWGWVANLFVSGVSSVGTGYYDYQASKEEIRNAIQKGERKFRVYPPYWFFRANAAMRAGNDEECRKSYAKFNEVWRPVLNYDPYKLEAVNEIAGLRRL